MIGSKSHAKMTLLDPLWEYNFSIDILTAGKDVELFEKYAMSMRQCYPMYQKREEFTQCLLAEC